MVSGCLCKGCNIVQDGICHIYFLYLILKHNNFFFGNNRCCFLQRICGLPVPKQLYQVFVIRIAHGKAYHKSVQLGFRQHLGSRRSGRVLCSNDYKGLGNGMCLVIHGYFSFFHNFQKGCLGFAGGTVDLVRQKNIAHGCAGTVKEAILFPVIYGKACNISR